ncbi:MAG: LLM class flavin-dependent oxidoreductase [Gammaproteobacteria bacterium]|jgi:alkanesulfonate monooxygenase SsuD/methylene tetrahydromethanopterin reductase-like flavin-dependent oxidoreductase (luciferase family)|nr:LLM class flavin-dependent oxidoreductase [Gammaproteobacteria bacterium]MBT5603838.1 LLM class flavin-dependent oxidoreductase [Gammaproteobacteria bacterium]
MKFGIFFELSTPRPFSREVEWQVYHNALEQCRLADELGFDHVWAVEHHFLEEYSHSSAPEVFLAAVAAQTQRIRIGHGAVVCVPEMNHPVRVAERAAALDIISNGRLEVGTARSSTWTELGGFGVNPDDTKKTWDEFVRVLPKMWTQEEFSWHGKGFSMPSRNVLPKPYQDPHPPLWVTVTTPGTELDAADRGLGCLGVSSAGYEEQERRTREYHRRVQVCEPAGGFINDQVHTMNFLYCHEDYRKARRVGLPMVNSFNIANTHLYWTREAYPTRAYQTLGNAGAHMKPKKPAVDDPSVVKGLPEGVGIGDPEHLIQTIKKWESIGVTGINFLLNAMEMIPQQQVKDSMKLFAREVMPKFHRPAQIDEAVFTPSGTAAAGR